MLNKTLKLTFVSLLTSLPFAFWGFAYEFSYFKILGLNVFDTFNYIYYVLSGGKWVLIIFLSIMLVTAIIKFFSKNIEKDDWKDVKESLTKTQFADVIGLARIGFIISVIYLGAVIYFPDYWFSIALGSQHLLASFFILQLFFAAIWLSPQQSKFAVIILFIISIGACFGGGGIGNARGVLKLQETAVRDDYLVTINRTVDGKYVAKPKSLKLPLPIIFRKVLGL